MTSRAAITKQIEESGIVVNNARIKCLESNYNYTAGVLRTAEEGLKVAFDALSDPSVKESEL